MREQGQGKAPPAGDPRLGLVKEGVSGGSEIPIQDLIAILWRRRLHIAAAATVFFVLAFLYVTTMKPKYAAVAIVTAGGSGELYGDAIQGGLAAALRGPISSFLSMGPGKAARPYERFLFHLTSLPLARELATRHGGMQFFFHEAWDPETQSWSGWRGFLGELNASFTRLTRFPSYNQPTIEDLSRMIEESLSVVEIEGGTFHQIEYRHSSPEYAEAALKLIISTADELVKRSAQERAAAQIEHLLGQIASNTNAEHREVLIDLLAEQQRNFMLSGGSQTYAVDLIAVPKGTDYPPGPGPLVLIVTITLLGTVLSIFAIYAFELMKGETAPWARFRPQKRSGGVKPVPAARRNPRTDPPPPLDGIRRVKGAGGE